jgi:hypothetical protein
MDLATSGHDDDAEKSYLLEVETRLIENEWVPRLPEFDVGKDSLLPPSPAL